MRGLGDAYRGRRVLVTGHTGFKGAWLTAWLKRLGAEVCGLALDPPTSPSLFARLELGKQILDLRGDVREPTALRDALAASTPDVVFHLAGQALVGHAWRYPLETLQTNLMGTVHLIEQIRRGGWRCGVVLITTDKCYADPEAGVALREQDALGGDEPYAASKAAAEIAARAWVRTYFPVDRLAEHGVAVATARAGNVLGPDDHAEGRLVPDCMRALFAGRAPEIRRPHAIRPWQHVLDPLAGYLKLGAALAPDAPVATRAAASGPWNFGPRPEDQAPVGHVVAQVLAAFGRDPTWETGEAGFPEAGCLRLAIDRAITHLGWQPTWPLDTAIAHTVAGYRALHHADPAAASAWVDDHLALFEADASRDAQDLGVSHVHARALPQLRSPRAPAGPGSGEDPAREPDPV